MTAAAEEVLHRDGAQVDQGKLFLGLQLLGKRGGDFHREAGRAVGEAKEDLFLIAAFAGIPLHGKQRVEVAAAARQDGHIAAEDEEPGIASARQSGKRFVILAQMRCAVIIAHGIAERDGRVHGCTSRRPWVASAAARRSAAMPAAWGG